DDLPQRGDIRLDSISLLCAAGRHTEAGHYFIKNQDSTGAFCQIAKKLQIACGGRNTPPIAHPRLNNDTSNITPAFFEFRFQRFRIIEGKDDRELRKVFRYTRAVGQSERRDTRAGFYQKTIAMSVIAAVKLHNAIPPRKTTRQTDRAHR